MSEYGETKSLQEILEELALYCAVNMADPNGIRVIIPKKALEAFSRSFAAKERIVLTGDAPKSNSTITAVWNSSGCVRIHTLEENEEVIKGLI